MDKLTEQIGGSSSIISELTKNVASVRKYQGIIGNKADKLSSELSDLKKRLTKLEQKKGQQGIDSNGKGISGTIL